MQAMQPIRFIHFLSRSLFLSFLCRCRRRWRIVFFLFIFPTDVSIFHNFYRMCINCRKGCCKRRRQHNASKGIPHNGEWIVGEWKKGESNVLCVHSRAQNITINWKEKRDPKRNEKDRSSGRCVRRRCSMTLMNSITNIILFASGEVKRSITARAKHTIENSTTSCKSCSHAGDASTKKSRNDILQSSAFRSLDWCHVLFFRRILLVAFLHLIYFNLNFSFDRKRMD